MGTILSPGGAGGSGALELEVSVIDGACKIIAALLLLFPIPVERSAVACDQAIEQIKISANILDNAFISDQ